MKRQRGFVLVVAMVFLLIMTLLGTTIMANTVLEERMAGNFSDSNTALQSSESALAACEDLIIGWVAEPIPFDPTNYTDGFHLPSLTVPIYSPNNSVWESTDVIEYDTLEAPLNLPDQPVCIIEHLGTVNIAVPPAPPVLKNNFRVSAKGYGRNGAIYFSQSVMQR